jgi:hypothetical protein
MNTLLAEIPVLKVGLAIIACILVPFLLQIINYIVHPERRPSVRKAMKQAQRENPPE